jgi:hypothetical protein
MISPTPGRVVWFYPNGEAKIPLAAMVAFVHSDRLVNLGCLDANGCPFNATFVTLVQEGDERPAGPHATWMPYQIGQAKKETGVTGMVGKNADDADLKKL